MDMGRSDESSSGSHGMPKRKRSHSFNISSPNRRSNDFLVMPLSSPVLHRSLTRRDFLATTSVALAALSVGARVLPAAALGRHPANVFLPEPIPADLLHTLAARALEAAKSAGAQYADIRLSQQQSLGIQLPDGVVPMTTLGARFSYGIRVMVDGALAFDYGTVPTPGAVAATARNAVTQARGFSTLTNDRVEFAPAPVTTGAWTSPYQIDPFAVPILEQADLLGALSAATGRVEGAAYSDRFNWQRETRVCASSEGTQTTQTFMRARS
jgi:TldD protein